MEFYLMGDFNIDLLQSHCNQIIKTYAGNLLGYLGKCCINKPTRIHASWEEHFRTIFFSLTSIAKKSNFTHIFKPKKKKKKFNRA